MIKMSDVAKIAGVSKATVSRVLNGSKATSEDIRKRVMDAIEKTGYKPNLVARALSSSESKTIGFIAPSLHDEIMSRLLQEIEANLDKAGYRLIVCHTKYDLEKEKSYLSQFIQNNVDGLIVSTSKENAHIYKGISIPTIIFDQYVVGGPITMTTDNFYGGYMSGKKLIEKNCKNILVINTIFPDIAYQERVNGFKKIMNESNTSYMEIKCSNNIKECSPIILETLKQNHFDGVFGTSDLLAAYAIKQIYKLNLKVPENIKVIGYGDTKISDLVTPSITTTSQNVDNVAKKIIEFLLARIQKMQLKKRFIIMPVRMIEKDST